MLPMLQVLHANDLPNSDYNYLCYTIKTGKKESQNLKRKVPKRQKNKISTIFQRLSFLSIRLHEISLLLECYYPNWWAGLTKLSGA